MSRVKRQTSPHAANLRAALTDAERRLWHGVRDRRLSGHKFRRQTTLGPYIVDFLCVEAMLIVELDGDQHFIGAAVDYDARRTRYLEKLGYRVLRFGNVPVLKETTNILDTILGVLIERTPSPAQASPESPLPQAGEGDGRPSISTPLPLAGEATRAPARAGEGVPSSSKGVRLQQAPALP